MIFNLFLIFISGLIGVIIFSNEVLINEQNTMIVFVSLALFLCVRICLERTELK